MRAQRHLPLNRPDHFRRTMPEQQGAMPAEVVDVLMTVHAPLTRPPGALDVERVGIEDARVVREPAREHRFGTLVERGRFRGPDAIALGD